MPPIPPASTLARERTFQIRLRECSTAFARTGISQESLPAVLAVMAAEAATLLGSSRASIWLVDRRAQELWMAASSDTADPRSGARVARTDPLSPAALGMSLGRPALVGEGPLSALVAPLRGWRRALGTLVLEGDSGADLDPAQTIELAHEVSRQLSAVIENLQLLEEVVRQRRLLEDTFNSLVDLVIVTDNGLRVVQTNDALAASLGRTREELFESRLETVVGDTIATWILEPETGAPWAAGTPRPTGARTRMFEESPLGNTVVVTVTPLVSNDNRLLGRVIVARDVTQQVRLEAEREALRARLAQSEKLASLGQFVAGVAHEINNPLQGVLGYVELMLRADSAPAARGELRRVLHEADRAAKIVRNLLVFSGSQRMVLRRLTVERVIGRALASRRSALAKQGIRVVRRQPEAPRAIAGDPLLLQQAILNILINAEHAIASRKTPGTIEIDTEVSADGTMVVTRIRDDGSGIDAEVLTRIFDPFFTTKEVGKGTGLGLTIAYGIVQDHGGTVHAANAPHGGAVFTIELPAAPERPAPARRRRPPR